MPALELFTIALFGACAYGIGDFIGGRASNGLGTACAGAIALNVAAVGAIVLLPTGVASTAPSGFVPAGILAGLCHASGVLLLYHAFANGRISIAAPLSGLIAVAVPVLGDVALEGAIEPIHGLGIGFAAVAVVLLNGAGASGRREVAFSVKLGAASGLAFGLGDLCLGVVPAAAAPVAFVSARIAGAVLALFVLAALSSPSRLRQTDGAAPIARVAPGVLVVAGLASAMVLLAAVAGLLDGAGQLAYVTAATRGKMSIAAAVTSLYPAVSVLLGVLVLGERLIGQQSVGLAAGAIGAVLLAA